MIHSSGKHSDFGIVGASHHIVQREVESLICTAMEALAIDIIYVHKLSDIWEANPFFLYGC